MTPPQHVQHVYKSGSMPDYTGLFLISIISFLLQRLQHPFNLYNHLHNSQLHLQLQHQPPSPSTPTPTPSQWLPPRSPPPPLLSPSLMADPATTSMPSFRNQPPYSTPTNNHLSGTAMTRKRTSASTKAAPDTTGIFSPSTPTPPSQTLTSTQTRQGRGRRGQLNPLPPSKPCSTPQRNQSPPDPINNRHRQHHQ